MENVKAISDEIERILIKDQNYIIGPSMKKDHQEVSERNKEYETGIQSIKMNTKARERRKHFCCTIRTYKR
jgi:hypothetical protein